MRILIIDKLASFRRRVRAWLVDGGHTAANILEAASGAAGMELLRREEFNVDAILCEWDQPAVGALEFLKQLRAVPGFVQIGFVAVGPGRPELQAEAARAGATQYLAQPLDPEALLQSLVAIEKAAIAAKKRTPSPTTRWRILTLDQKTPPPGDAPGAAVAFAELRRGSHTVYLNPGEALAIPKGGPLYWIDHGALGVRERRSDGIVLEYRAGPGEFVNEAPFGGFVVQDIAVRSEGEAWLSTRDAASVETLRRRLPTLFYFFRNVANERLRKFQKSPDKRSAERGLAGEIESLPVGDLVGILNGARKTGVLRIDAPDRSFFFHFVEGAIRHAESDGEVGEDVFYRALLLPAGRFEFMVGPAVEGPVTIALQTDRLLIEGLRRRAQHYSKAPRPRTE
jgi:CheY-like chemotaxis protein